MGGENSILEPPIEQEHCRAGLAQPFDSNLPHFTWKWVSHLPGSLPSRGLARLPSPGFGGPAGGTESLSVPRSSRCQPSLASRGHCHAVQTVPASACRTCSSPLGGPQPSQLHEAVVLSSIHPLSEELSHPLDRVTGSSLRPASRLSGGSRSPQPCGSS